MAEAAKKKQFKLPSGVKRAVLKPGKANGEGKASPLSFAASPDDSQTEQDFDAILKEVMAAPEGAPSSMTAEETDGTAALARRLAERVQKARAPESERAQPRDKAEAPAVAADAVAPDEEDDDALAEPADLQRLLEARTAVATQAPHRPGGQAAPKQGVKSQPSIAEIHEPAEPPILKPFPKDDEEMAEIKPLPEDEPQAELRPLPDDEDGDSLRDELKKRLAEFDAARAEDEVDADALADPDDDADILRDLVAGRRRGGDDGQPPADAPAAAGLAANEEKGHFFRRFADGVTPIILWISVALMIGSLVYGTWQGGVDLVVVGLLAAGLLSFATILTVASLTNAYSPTLLTGFLFRRARMTRNDAAVLAGNDILQSLGLAEGIIDADADARLVTTRQGVVVYANDAYLKIAEEAGIRGGTGLPPRIDRLFGQSGTESSKMFRLAKACRSGAPAEEELTQAMGHAGHGGKGELPVRRFLVTVRPMRPSSEGEAYSVWRLQELEVDRQQDTLKAAFRDYPRPVVAVERSGSIAWMNGAASRFFGTKPGQPVALTDLVLGEVTPLVRHVWEPDADEYEVRVRQRGKGGVPETVDVVLTPFTRGGAGEGFVCVEVIEKSFGQSDPTGVQAGADLTDAPFGVAVLEGDPSADGKVTYANALFSSYFPAAKEGARFTSVLAAPDINELSAALRSRQPQKPLTKPIEVRVGEGAQAHTFRLFARPVRRRRGAYGPRQTVLYAVDITFQRRMEEDHVQGQKLQQIGQIAGSVAHDFNNLLVIIMGSTELLMRNHPVGDPSYKDLSMIYETGQRAKNLTRNLLAFSRKQTLKPEVCSITELLNDFTPALKRYVSEKVTLDVVHGRNVPEVKADKGQIHLAIMNLAVNARDAMPAGGSLRIETKTIKGSEIGDYGYEVLDEVDHVLIEVADTGGGVPADIADKIFEPFFTTKGEGQGTGLGLSTVAGTIAQMGGRVFLYNRPGEGATFRIFLPAVSEEEAKAAADRRQQIAGKISDESTDPTGKGRILVVEDEDGVRSIVVRALGMCGYDIVEATDGDEALEMIEEDEGHFDLVLTDIMMPEMDGPTLIQEAGDKLNGAKVVFMSGYAETTMREKLNAIEGARYLQKPFTLAGVAAVVKEALASR